MQLMNSYMCLSRTYIAPLKCGFICLKGLRVEDDFNKGEINVGAEKCI